MTSACPSELGRAAQNLATSARNGQAEHDRIKPAGDCLGPARAAPRGPGLGQTAAGSTEAQRPRPGRRHRRMTQQPPPGRRRRPAARSREPRQPRPADVCSVPGLRLHGRRDRRSPRVARVGPRSASPQPALLPALPLSRPAPGAASARHARTDVTSGALGARRKLLRVPLRIRSGWSEAEAGVNDGTCVGRGVGGGGGRQASPRVLTCGLQELAEKPVGSGFFRACFLRCHRALGRCSSVEREPEAAKAGEGKSWASRRLPARRERSRLKKNNESYPFSDQDF